MSEFMVYFSSFVLLLGLQYHEMSLDTGAQTIRLGWAGPVSYVLGGIKATGVGEREMAEEGINFFTELKTVFTNYAGSTDRSMIR